MSIPQTKVRPSRWAVVAPLAGAALVLGATAWAAAATPGCGQEAVGLAWGLVGMFALAGLSGVLGADRAAARRFARRQRERERARAER